MPYILKEHRYAVDDQLDELIDQIQRHAPEDRGGILNYAVTRLMLGVTESYAPLPRYRHFSRTVGDIQCCLQEFHRRHVAPYEDAAMKRNGDVA